MEAPYKPVASGLHTGVIASVLLLIAARGAMFQASTTATAAGDVYLLYLSLVVSELLLVYAIMRGMKRSGTSLADLTGGRWRNVADVARDVLIGAVLWAILKGVASFWDTWSPVRGAVRSINPLLPVGAAETAVWIIVSIVGGIAEELVFRGYFQRQFEALTQSRWVALALQAILFGVTHGYQGVSACIKISLIGALFGACALWRRSLRPSMLAHVWTDISSGVFRI